MELSEVDNMMEEVVELPNFSILSEDEVGVSIQLIPADDENFTTPKHFPVTSNQGAAVYNVDWVHGGICVRRLMGAKKHNPRFNFSPDIDPTKLQPFQFFLFGDFIEGVLLHNINSRIKG